MAILLPPQQSAFLATVRHSEGSDRAPDPYRVCFGFKHTIQSLWAHPAISGEWKGERLPDADCVNAGYEPGCVSTAAGAYQILVHTWRDAAHGANLADFTADSQDKAAIWLIDRAGALPFVMAGALSQAFLHCRNLWMSLPGAAFKQPQRVFADLQAFYDQQLRAA